MVPIVQDNKNAALLRIPGRQVSETTMTTLQHALMRGLELVFQLEEGGSNSSLFLPVIIEKLFCALKPQKEALVYGRMVELRRDLKG